MGAAVGVSPGVDSSGAEGGAQQRELHATLRALSDQAPSFAGQPDSEGTPSAWQAGSQDVLPPGCPDACPVLQHIRLPASCRTAVCAWLPAEEMLRLLAEHLGALGGGEGGGGGGGGGGSAGGGSSERVWSGGGGGGGMAGGAPAEVSSLMDSLMQQLLSKEVLYQPMKASLAGCPVAGWGPLLPACHAGRLATSQPEPHPAPLAGPRLSVCLAAGHW